MISTLRLWRKLADKPLGKRLFSWAVSLKAPYFRTVRPRVAVLRPGYCEVHAANRWRVHNHIGTFHAIAACNLAEIAMGMLAEASVESTHRWIPTGMNVEYLAKARTDLRAIAELNPLPACDDKPHDWEVPVRVLDTEDATVVSARITVRVSPKG